MSGLFQPESRRLPLNVNPRREYTGHHDLGAQVDFDTWLTPRFILDRLGPFDLDPCAAAGNPSWVCQRSFTKGVGLDQDGLSQPWAGRVFMNPPFSAVRPWLRRHAAYGRGISLVPATVESQIWRDVVWPQAKAVLLLTGRTRFCNPDGSSTTGRPLRSVALVGWDAQEVAILAASGLAGVFLTSWHQTR